MFNFSTTTVVNSLKDWTSKKDLLTKVTKTDTDGTVHKSLMVKRHLEFKKENIQAAYIREYQDEVAPVVEFTLTNVVNAVTAKTKVFRLNLYIGLTDSQDSRYANSLVYKGRPIMIEFPVKVGMTATQIADSVVKIANRYVLAVYEDKLFNIKNDSGKIVIEGISGEQVIKKAAIEVWDKDEQDFVEMDSYKQSEGNVTSSMVQLTKVNNPGFGTYRNIMKNMRLPTSANLRFGHILEDEAPILGAQYDQFTIYYCVHRGVLGSDAVGDDVTSVTNHVFYVKRDVANTVNADWLDYWKDVLDWDDAKIKAEVAGTTFKGSAGDQDFVKVGPKTDNTVQDIPEPTEFIKK